MRIKSVLLTCSAIFSLLLLQNCGPDGKCQEPNPQSAHYNISEANKKKIPFSGADTLVYISTSGDTAILYGQGKSVFIKKVSKQTSIDPGCPTYNYDYLEHINFTYTGDHNDLKKIFIDCAAEASSYESVDVDINIGSVRYFTRLGYINHLVNYKDTVTIGPLTYDAIEISSGGSGINFPYYYNYQYGLLKITTAKNVWLKKM